MKTRTTLAQLGVLALLTATSFAKDEPYLRADHKMLGHQLESSQRHAQEQAQTLYYYGRAPQPVQKHEAKELVDAVRKDLATANKALAALQAEYAKNKAAIELIDSIKKHHAKAEELCGMAEEACLKEPAESGEVADCCTDMYHEMEAARADTQKLLKLLKIEKLEPPKKSGEKNPAPKKSAK